MTFTIQLLLLTFCILLLWCCSLTSQSSASLATEEQLQKSSLHWQQHDYDGNDVNDIAEHGSNNRWSANLLQGNTEQHKNANSAKSFNKIRKGNLLGFARLHYVSKSKPTDLTHDIAYSNSDRANVKNDNYHKSVWEKLKETINNIGDSSKTFTKNKFYLNRSNKYSPHDSNNSDNIKVENVNKANYALEMGNNETVIESVKENYNYHIEDDNTNNSIKITNHANTLKRIPELTAFTDTRFENIIPLSSTNRVHLPLIITGTGVTAIEFTALRKHTLGTVIQLRNNRYDSSVASNNCAGVSVTIELRREWNTSHYPYWYDKYDTYKNIQRSSNEQYTSDSNDSKHKNNIEQVSVLESTTSNIINAATNTNTNADKHNKSKWKTFSSSILRKLQPWYHHLQSKSINYDDDDDNDNDNDNKHRNINTSLHNSEEIGNTTFYNQTLQAHNILNATHSSHYFMDDNSYSNNKAEQNVNHTFDHLVQFDQIKPHNNSDNNNNSAMPQVSLMRVKYIKPTSHDNNFEVVNNLFAQKESMLSRPVSSSSFTSSSSQRYFTLSSLLASASELESSEEHLPSIVDTGSGEGLKSFWNSMARMFDTSAFCEILPNVAMRVNYVLVTEKYYYLIYTNTIDYMDDGDDYYHVSRNNDIGVHGDSRLTCVMDFYIDQVPFATQLRQQFVFGFAIPYVILVLPLPFLLWHSTLIQELMENVDFTEWFWYLPYGMRDGIVALVLLFVNNVRNAFHRRAERIRQRALQEEHRRLMEGFELRDTLPVSSANVTSSVTILNRCDDDADDESREDVMINRNNKLNGDNNNNNSSNTEGNNHKHNICSESDANNCNSTSPPNEKEKEEEERRDIITNSKSKVITSLNKESTTQTHSLHNFGPLHSREDSDLSVHQKEKDPLLLQHNTLTSSLTTLTQPPLCNKSQSKSEPITPIDNNNKHDHHHHYHYHHCDLEKDVIVKPNAEYSVHTDNNNNNNKHRPLFAVPPRVLRPPIAQYDHLISEISNNNSSSNSNNKKKDNNITTTDVQSASAVTKSTLPLSLVATTTSSVNITSSMNNTKLPETEINSHEHNALSVAEPREAHITSVYLPEQEGNVNQDNINNSSQPTKTSARTTMHKEGDTSSHMHHNDFKKYTFQDNDEDEDDDNFMEEYHISVDTNTSTRELVRNHDILFAPITVKKNYSENKNNREQLQLSNTTHETLSENKTNISKVALHETDSNNNNNNKTLENAKHDAVHITHQTVAKELEQQRNEDINNNNNNNNTNINNNDDDEEEEEDGYKFCRICREDDSDEKLISPCACTGSVR